jgi:hypothetical protein
MLQIGIGTSASLIPYDDQPSLFMEDDGYYEFLCPLFSELFVVTGQMVDPYENACFEKRKY